MKNFKTELRQFSQRPEEFAQYLKDEKGVNITGNSGIVKVLLILAIGFCAVLGGAWLYNHYKNREDNSVENGY